MASKPCAHLDESLHLSSGAMDLGSGVGDRAAGAPLMVWALVSSAALRSGGNPPLLQSRFQYKACCVFISGTLKKAKCIIWGCLSYQLRMSLLFIMLEGSFKKKVLHLLRKE